jgi:hypothetical protein
MQSCNQLVKVGRRQFLRGGATAAATTVAAAMAPRRGMPRWLSRGLPIRAPSLPTLRISRPTNRCKFSIPTRTRLG